MTEQNEYRPSSLSHLIGQDHVREVVSTALDFAFQEGVPFPHSLALGPPGVGKTAMARVISQECASGFHECLSSAISSPAEFYAVLMKANDLDVVFFDELHVLDPSFQHALLIATDEGKIYLPNGGGGAPQAINLARFSLIGATTDEHKVIRPLVDRFKLILRFSYYTVPELTEIVSTRSRGYSWQVQSGVAEAIAERSKGVPRLAIRLLQSCWRVCRAAGDHAITTQHLKRACLLDQIDGFGLDATEQQYLQFLSDGPLRLNMLASMLGLPARTVSAVTESYLVRAGLITKDRQGVRMLTSKGMEHLGQRNAQ